MGWISYTNRAKEKNNKGKREMWVNSRWIWFIGEHGNKNISLQITSRPSFGWGINVEGCEREVTLRFWLLFTFYINFEHVFPEWIYAKQYNQFADEDTKALKREGSNEEKRWKVKKENEKLKGNARTKAKGWIRTGARELSLSFHNHSMWWEIWNDSDSWSNDTPKWRHGSFDFQELLKGKDKVDSNLIEEIYGEIKMPEGKYLCKINKNHYKRTYQRWFSKEWNRFEFEFGYLSDNGNWIKTPIVHWGKGENSYDCGMDGTYSISLSSEVKNIEEANKRILDSCLRDRVRYGNIDFSKVSGIENGIVKKNLIGEF